MALKEIALLALVVALPLGTARAQSPDAGLPEAAAPAAPAELEPPQPLVPTAVPYPADAPPHEQPIVVRIKISVGADGKVGKVELLSHSLPVFDDAVVRAAQAFTFQPARYGGQPVPVEISFTHTFQPPPPPPAPVVEAGPPLNSALRGRLVEMGTRLPVAGATVAALVGERHFTVETDGKGRFRLPVPSGDARITVHAAGYNPFLQQEHLAPQQELAVTYLIEREHYDPYEIVIVGEQHREEVSRITLRGPEIKQIPGTFGDPFRVIQALPGTASMVALLPFPVVRGASPNTTGFLLDGTRVPLLYHLLVGASVVHPEFIDEVQFYPGGAPVIYGGYTGGIVDGRTHRARSDEHLLIDLDVNFLQTGALIRVPIPQIGVTVTAAGRYGYPGLILSLATDRVSLSYWDYQFRLDGGNPRNGWTVSFFGAGDELDTRAATSAPGTPNPSLAPALILNFHRADLRAYHGSGGFDGLYRLVLGYDHTESSGSNVETWVAEPSARWHYRAGERLTLVWGVEGSLHDIVQGAPSSVVPNGFTLSTITKDLRALYVASALAETLWRPTSRWLIRPGVRADVYYDKSTTKAAADPRLTVRYKLTTRDLAGVPVDSDDSAVWLKAAVGIYHQPPRFILPLPGLDTMPLKYGLLQSIQSSLGVEVPLSQHFSASVEGYFAYMDPTIFDLTVNPQDVNTAGHTTLISTTVAPPTSDAQQFLDRLLVPHTGRAYGLETLIRRQAKSGLYGWLSYTLSRSERYKDGAWAPYDFDRTHLLNLVAGLLLPRNWDVGVRFQYQSGKPATTTYGYNTARINGYDRVDFRVDKRAVYRGWLLDFYVDIINGALLPEEVMPGATIRYVLPTVGLRGRF